MYMDHWRSPLGEMTLAGTDRELTGLWFAGQKYDRAGLTGPCTQRETPLFREIKGWLELYFSGRCPGFTPPLAWNTTPFRAAVWEYLLTIPYGCTATYGDIAAHIARQRGLASMSAQAVGGAVGHNPISIIVPCHRVVGAGGSLTGYAGGLERKQALLELERSIK